MATTLHQDPRPSASRLSARPWLPVAVAGLTGAALGVLACYSVLTPRWGVPHAVTGTVVAVNADANAFVVRPDGRQPSANKADDGGHGYQLGPVEWVDYAGQTHHEGTPVCLAPLSEGAKVELMVVDVRGGTGGPDALITRVRCLSAR
ncbi:hypothetical protein [Micromonospora sp. NPDC048947]|uniref:hypothetical protein n=1 Tax=Micromonospora sp. NPDC048947 TaxID=3154826 RepID=UPI0033E69086